MTYTINYLPYIWLVVSTTWVTAADK